ncbi:unnamed protein product [Cylicostephanus goldi]|uniref:Uncharacterized protein n=1 Tax=Cylicostephanus goldi TaxID=71465 RepID=A0A3P7NBV1_CYLGO|nr:unnamed protein product [Cylicostephanus goldi]
MTSFLQPSAIKNRIVRSNARLTFQNIAEPTVHISSKKRRVQVGGKPIKEDVEASTDTCKPKEEDSVDFEAAVRELECHVNAKDKSSETTEQVIFYITWQRFSCYNTASIF